jgi:GNAT superfamily N-acetyltransferase
MAQIDVRLGELDDVDAAVSIYERSNLARRQGDWPSRATRVAEVTALLHNAASWLLIGRDRGESVAMALLEPFRAEGGAGKVIAGTSFLNLIYVLPDRWGEGIGGAMLDAVIAEADRRGCPRIFLWTNEHQNERAHRLYRSRGFARTGRTTRDVTDKLIGEWLRDAAGSRVGPPAAPSNQS